MFERADRQVLSRDLIDLAALRARFGPIPDLAWAKVEAAYQSAARDDLGRALEAFSGDLPYQKPCFEGLSVVDPTPILEGLALLRRETSLDRPREL